MTDQYTEEFAARLRKIIETNSCDELDERLIERFLQLLDFPQCRVVGGLVYLHGHGRPEIIQTVAKNLLQKITEVN